MTREEEIHKAAEEFAFSDKTDTSDFHCAINDFYYGAKWADKTMIEKACNWIKEHVMIPYEGKFDGSETPITDYLEWCENRLKESERIINEFKKAMEK